MNKCVICEKPGDKTFTEQTIKTLADNLEKFKNANLLKLFSDSKEALIELLRLGGYKYHKTCYASFHESKLNIKIEYLNRKRKFSDEEHLISTRSKCPQTVRLKEFLCMFCDGPEIKDTKRPKNNKPLHAAASKQISSSYVGDFTDNIKKMVEKIDDKKILNILSK